MIKIVECPRDAMQGIKEFIPTEIKVKYLNQLLKVGYDTLDFGSFVSPRAIPQLKDTAGVLAQLDLSETKTKLLAIIANYKGAEYACKHPEINYLGYPFSISETFQKRNTNKTIKESFEELKRVQELMVKHNKKLVVYLSMAFGNPYEEVFNTEILLKQTQWLKEIDVRIVSLSDTTGVANKELIENSFAACATNFPEIEWGTHFHTQAHQWEEKIKTAYESGCKRFDGAIKGFGGCPYAKDDLVGNMPTEHVVYFLNTQKIDTGINKLAFEKSMIMAENLFSKYH